MAHNDVDEPSVDIERAAQHLFIWRRPPDSRGRLRSRLGVEGISRLQILLSGC